MMPSISLTHRVINRSALLLAIGWLLLIGLTLDPAVDDFERYWQASVDLLRYDDPYVTRADYFYPPFFVYLILPFGLLSHQQGQWLWFGLNNLALAGFLAVCIRESGSILARRYWGVVVLGMVIVPPTRLSLQLGQVSIMIALMLVDGIALARRNAVSVASAGMLLALASLVRLNPAFLGIYYLLRGPRRVAWWSIGTGIGLLLLSMLIYGFKHYTKYITTIVQANVAQQGAYPYAAEHNISFFGYWYRLLTVNPHSIPVADAPTLALSLVVVCSLVVFALCVLVLLQSVDYAGCGRYFSTSRLHRADAEGRGGANPHKRSFSRWFVRRSRTNQREKQPGAAFRKACGIAGKKSATPDYINHKRRKERTDGQSIEQAHWHNTLLRFSVWLCGMMILWPTNGYYNLMIVLLPVLLVVRVLEQMMGDENKQRQSRAIRAWLVLSVALMCIPPGWSKALPALYTHLHTGWGTLLLTPAMYGVCLFMGGLVWLIIAGPMHKDSTTSG